MLAIVFFCIVYFVFCAIYRSARRKANDDQYSATSNPSVYVDDRRSTVVDARTYNVQINVCRSPEDVKELDE